MSKIPLKPVIIGSPPPRAPQADRRGRSRNVRQGDKGARTREQIKDALVKLLSRKSVQDIVLDDICQETGLTVGAFYFHFKNKDAALEEVAIDALHMFYDRVLELPVTDSMRQDIEQLCTEMVAVCVDQPILVRLMAEGVQTKQGAREAWVQEHERLTGEYVTRLAQSRGHQGAGRGKGGTEQDQLDVQFMLYGLETLLEHALIHREPGYSMLKRKPEKLVERISSLALRSLGIA